MGLWTFVLEEFDDNVAAYISSLDIFKKPLFFISSSSTDAPPFKGIDQSESSSIEKNLELFHTKIKKADLSLMVLETAWLLYIY